MPNNPPTPAEYIDTLRGICRDPDATFKADVVLRLLDAYAGKCEEAEQQAARIAELEAERDSLREDVKDVQIAWLLSDSELSEGKPLPGTIAERKARVDEYMQRAAKGRPDAPLEKRPLNELELEFMAAIGMPESALDYLDHKHSRADTLPAQPANESEAPGPFLSPEPGKNICVSQPAQSEPCEVFPVAPSDSNDPNGVGWGDYVRKDGTGKVTRAEDAR